jgi:hypothetical protein
MIYFQTLLSYFFLDPILRRFLALVTSSTNDVASSEGQNAQVDVIIGGVFQGVDSWDSFAASLFWVFVVWGPQLCTSRRVGPFAHAGGTFLACWCSRAWRQGLLITLVPFSAELEHKGMI